MNSTVLMNAGMQCLIEKLGDVGAEQFISQIIREPFDYTKWQRSLYIGSTVQEINEAAVKYRKGVTEGRVR